MDVECTLNSYNKDGIASTLLKVGSVSFDEHNVRLTVIKQDGTSLSLNVIGDELISAIQKCMLNRRGV